MPWFSDLSSDPDGNLWVERYALPWEVGPARWDVFDSDGRWSGTVEVPADLEIHEIGANYVLGRAIDSAGVERIQLYDLIKSR